MAKTSGGRTRADDVYRRLRSDILAGRLRPGQRLQFPELCARYATSVGVAREALTQLAAEGLARNQSHHGYRVTPLSFEDLADLTAARTELESLVLSWAVRDGDMQWEARAVAAHHLLERTPSTVPDDPQRVADEWVAAHAAFHDALLVGCDNKRLTAMARSLRSEAELYQRWAVSLGHGSNRDVAGEHRALLDAALARDAELAATRLRDHIARTSEELIIEGDEEAAPGSPAVGARPM
jgi:DNA-binding GntR family transcriptional regulator